jgi:CRP/FNR family cyclic AMP-dependent transcriptional regulator
LEPILPSRLRKRRSALFRCRFTAFANVLARFVVTLVAQVRMVAAVAERISMAKSTSKKALFDPAKFLATVAGGRTVSKYRKGDTVFLQGDSADAVFYVQKGKVKITVLSEQGKEAVVAVLGPDEFCGEGCLAGQPRRMATASAMMECKIMRLEKAAIIHVLREPAFSRMFVSHLLARSIRVEEDLVDQLFNSSEKRLARALLLLANFGKEGRPEPIIANVSQEMLAEMIGTTRSRVSFFMNKFRRLGFINYNGHLEIHSSLLSVVLHDTPQIAAERNSDART